MFHKHNFLLTLFPPSQARPPPTHTHSGSMEDTGEFFFRFSQCLVPLKTVPMHPADLIYSVAVEPMFRAMSGCQVLHPDEQDTDSEAEEGT